MRKVVIMIAAIMVIDGINFDRRANLHDSFIIPHQLFDDPLLFDQLNKSQFCNWTTIFLWQCNFTLMINIRCVPAHKFGISYTNADKYLTIFGVSDDHNQ